MKKFIVIIAFHLFIGIRKPPNNSLITDMNYENMRVGFFLRFQKSTLANYFLNKVFPLATITLYLLFQLGFNRHSTPTSLINVKSCISIFKDSTLHKKNPSSTTLFCPQLQKKRSRQSLAVKATFSTQYLSSLHTKEENSSGDIQTSTFINFATFAPLTVYSNLHIYQSRDGSAFQVLKVL